MAKRAVRRASPQGGVDYNQTRADLEACIKNLQFKLKTEGHVLTRSKRLEFEKSLLVMKVGNAFLKKAGCVSPHMTFEFRKYAEAKARARQRRR